VLPSDADVAISAVAATELLVGVELAGERYCNGTTGTGRLERSCESCFAVDAPNRRPWIIDPRWEDCLDAAFNTPWVGS
jgi:hypothetical protein